MGRRRAFVGVGYALVAPAAIVAACETFDALRGGPRAGGAVTDVITGLDEPIDVEIDSAGRFVIATLLKGVFRGPKSGCVAPPTAAGPSIGGLAVYDNTVWYAEGAVIKRVSP